jgi:enamine deaminase RidA (YjgF/YER057c/UK114 family)
MNGWQLEKPSNKGSKMSDRRSISIDGLSHLTAIPVATRVGPLLVSSVIAPFNPGTRDAPDSMEEQYANIFRHTDLMLSEAGASWADVAKMEFWLPDAEGRAALEAPWLEKFPDEASRPSRHTHVGHGQVATASFIAFICE